MLVFEFGERRHVILDVYSCKNESFEIQQASYEFFNSDGTVEASGVCSIYEHQIDIVIEPQKRGWYMLKITYRILDEILIEQIRVTVM